MRIDIAHSWDGIELAADQVAHLDVAWEDNRLRIDVDAPFSGDPAPPGPPGSLDGLWSYEVVELFVVADNDVYTEIELSPHGHHWVIHLQGIRNPVKKAIAIEFEAQIEGDRWKGTAWVSRDELPAGPTTFNAFRIAGVAQARRFAAHAPVPGDRPDFHRLHMFPAWPL